MSRTTTNLGLTAVTNSETIGDFSDAMNASGGNLDIIDGKMGAVGNTSLQAQINTLNSKLIVFKTVAYGQTVSAQSSITVPVESGAGTYIVFVSRSDKCKTGMFITDAYGTTELAYCGVAVSLTSNGVVVQNNNVFTMSATVYRVI